MENKMSTHHSRSLFRRVVVPWGLSLAVFGTGGWGVVHFTTGSGANVQQSSHSARSASSAADDLKQLFASPPPSPTKKSPATGSTVRIASTDRYATVPSNPESASGQPEAVKTSRPKPAETAVLAPARLPESSTTMVGNRYAATAMPAPVTPKPEPTTDIVLEAEEKLVTGDVARGQEPAALNPLRARPTLSASATTAQAATNTAPIPNTPNTGSPRTPNPLASSSNMFSSEQNSLRPAQAVPESTAVQQPQTPLPRNRYGSTAQRNIALPASSDYGSSPAMASNGRPAPAFDMNPNGMGTPQPVPSIRKSPSPLEPNFGGAADDITPTPGLTNAPGTGRPGERLLEGLQSPSVTIQKIAPEEIQVGKRCTYAIRVQNTGQRTVQNVQIHDEIPLGTELVGSAPRASVSGSQVVWDVGTLSVGEERTVELELLPTEEGELGSVASVTFATQASAKARCTKPELALRLSSKPQVHAGQQQIVQIEVSNPGSGNATNVMLLETIPTGVSHEAGPALEFEIGTLQPGESRRLELMLTAEQSGRIENVMTARADAGLQVQASCQFEVIAPELQLSVEGPKRRYLERPATYQVIVDNPGTASAKEVQLVTQLPKGLQFVSANNMGEYDRASHSVHWSLAELPANERGTVELVALPIESGEHTLQIATKAQQGLEDHTETQVRVEGIVALMFEVKDTESPIEIGGETTYEIQVTNQGSKSASNVQVAAIMPQGMRAISGQGESRHAIQGERVVFAPLPQLAPKADALFRIHAQGLRAGDQRVRVQVTSDEVQQPITKEVSTRVYADQ